MFSGKLIVKVDMTDEDVVQRAAAIMGSTVLPLATKEAHHKTPYRASISGDRAEILMQTILPLLGARRTGQASHAMQMRTVHRQAAQAEKDLQQRARDTQLLTEWHSRPEGESEREFFNHCTVYRRTSGKPRLQALLANESLAALVDPIEMPQGLQLFESFEQLSRPEFLAWVAGLLEGEGYFGSRGLTPDIQLSMTDEDVVLRFHSAFGGSFRTAPERKEDWKPLFVASLKGEAAEQLMVEISPSMGLRRSAKIAEILQHREDRTVWKKTNVDGTVRRYFGPSNGLNEFGDAALTDLWVNRTTSENTITLSERFGVDSRTLINALIRLGVYEQGGSESSTRLEFTCAHCRSKFYRNAERGQQCCSPACYRELRRGAA